MATDRALAGTSEGGFVRLARAFASLAGWRRLVVAFLLGGLSAAALPPLHVVPLLWPAFAGLIWLLDGVRRGAGAFLTGWAFGAGHFLAGLYWVGIAFLVDVETYAAFLPLAVAGLALGMGLFPALAIWATWRGRRRGLSQAFVLGAAWLAVEWVRSWILTGFPWNLLGSIWVFSDAMVQLAAVTGVWGLSLITVVAAAAPAALGEPSEGPPLRRWAPIGLSLAILGLAWGGGAWRLAAAPGPGQQAVAGVRLKLIQPNIEQTTKWQPELRKQHVVDQMAMSRSSNDAGNRAPATHVIWAETAVPFNISGEAELRQALAEAVPPGGLLITGAPRVERDNGQSRLWNSLHALSATGAIVGTYDKFHLVPFGEYVPLKWLLGFTKVTQGRLDFSAGPGPQTLTLPGLPPVSPLICYEAIFPSAVTADGARPAWLLNITNDAWFGTSTGPYQHLASARLRAVEEGLPLVRVANSGISAVVDSYGRVLERLALNTAGVIDSPLPEPLDGRTLFSRIGNWSVLALVLLALLAGLAPPRRPAP
ncbi:MAG: apolipoprotein N-acyltransferase [Rhodospirillales bacterium]|nr:apolipoprotein N-acyltransferase [Rhodospirillales bacterium]